MNTPDTTKSACRPSTVLCKMGVAVTGAGLIGFVLAHMLGNLQVFLPGEKLNAYAFKLQSMTLIWVARAGLLGLFLTHLLLVFRLRSINSKARPVAYASYATEASTAAARYMLWTGMVILLFVVFHLAHFTFHTSFAYPELPQETVKLTKPPYAGAETHNVKDMVIYSFQDPVVSILYVVAQLALVMHLWHGGQSLLQTLGLRNESRRSWMELVGPALAIVVGVGNIAVPLAALLGLIEPLH